MSDTPKFKHDCSVCTFLGHYANHDVYACYDKEDSTLIARHGDEESEYHSTRLRQLVKQFERNGKVSIIGSTKRLQFHDYLFSESAAPFYKAWALALVFSGMSWVNFCGTYSLRHGGTH